MSELAPILEQAPGLIRFAVDDVTAPDSLLPVEPAPAQLARRLAATPLASSQDASTALVVGTAIPAPKTNEAVWYNPPTLIGARMIATGVAQFFERLLAAEGRYYFDDPEFVEAGSLALLEHEAS